MTREGCPRKETLSALVDGALAAHDRDEFEAHAARCPACGAALATLNALRASFAALPAPRVGFDLAPAIADRIRAAERPRGARPGRERSRWWQAFPAAVGTAAALSAGAYLGAFLVAGGVASGRPAIEMSAFGTVPPGGLCLGPACDTRVPR
jgi:anti-sigma factor RsiW